MLKKIIFSILLVLNIVFLVVAILTWNLMLSICAFIIAFVLSKFMNGIWFLKQKEVMQKVSET